MSPPLNQSSWISQLPSVLACGLLSIYLVAGQLYPCDSTSVALGSSMVLIAIAFGVGILVSLDAMLHCDASNANSSRLLLSLLLIAFSVWLLLSTLATIGLGNARYAFNGFWQWTAQWILLLSVVRLAASRLVASQMLSVMVACVAGTVGYSLYQYAISMPAMRDKFSENANSILRELGYAPGSAEAMLFIQRLQSSEPIGPFALTNSLAGLMAVWMVFLSASLVIRLARPIHHQVTSKHFAGISSWLMTVLLIGSFTVLLLTKSRTAWLAVFVGLLGAFVVLPPLRQQGLQLVLRFRAAFAIVAISALGALLALLVRDPAILSTAGKSIAYRVDYWQGAVKLLSERPLLGWGVANFQQNYNRVKLITASESPADPHNFFLETACAGGWPLLGLLLIGLVLMGRQLWVAARTSSEPFTESSSKIESTAQCWAVAIGLVMACLGAMVWHFFMSDDDTLYMNLIFCTLTLAIYGLSARQRWFEFESLDAIAWWSTWVLLLHWLASGGWMQPGLMNSFCVLVGVAIALQTNQAITHPSKLSSRSVAVAAFVLMVLATIGFLNTMGLPIIRASEVASDLTDQSRLRREPETWLEVLQADPYDPELPRMVASQCLQAVRNRRLSDSERAKWERTLDNVMDEYIRRDPHQWMPWIECGRWNLELSSQTTASPQREPSPRAIKAFEQFSKAAELYPNSAHVQLQAAVGAAAVGNLDAARTHLETAERIDSTTPHADRKLAGVVVFAPIFLESKDFSLSPSARQGQDPGYALGEPVRDWLRTLLRP